MEKTGLEFGDEIDIFIALAENNGVKMLMVGGGAVNFHGYQRHSADVDFWIELSDENMEKLKSTLNQMGYEFDEFPEKVKNGLQNISIKVSPDTELELITKFNPGKTFEQAFECSEETKVNSATVRVLSYEDLIKSKKKAMRPKDLLDIKELERINRPNKKTKSKRLRP
jgi:predicted nucleotidyltransferase